MEVSCSVITQQKVQTSTSVALSLRVNSFRSGSCVNVLVLTLEMYTSARHIYIYIYIYIYLAHLQQEGHNSKFGIFELLVKKETFADALLTGIVS